jgi:hypothetical protein
MPDPLAQTELMPHVHALAGDIGPRPATQPAEVKAHDYVRDVLHQGGVTGIEYQPFPTRTTIATAVTTPLLMALAGNLISLTGHSGRIVGGSLTLFATFNLWRLFGGQRLPLEILEPRQTSANLIARIPPRRPAQQTVVLIAHVDSARQRTLQQPSVRHLMLQFTTGWLTTVLLNGIAQFMQHGGFRWPARLVQWLSAAFLANTLRQAWLDERNQDVAGANDNASAVAVVLGLARSLQVRPLDRTEVWCVFTGAEEVGCIGMQHFLDRYGPNLRHAWFVDFEMVGTEQIVYVTRHSGLSYLNGYQPDAESLAWAQATARAYPELQVVGRELVIMEEVGTLRGRGYRGLCIAGVGADGWLANWHQPSDTVDQIVPGGVECAARFGRALLEERDRGWPI